MNKLNSHGKRLIIVGGGLSGLSFLHYLRNFAVAFKKERCLGRMVLIEANKHMGGSVASNRYEDGIVHELGPRTLRIGGVGPSNTISLIEQLGLGDQVRAVTHATPATKCRYIYVDGKLHKAPRGPGQLLYRIPVSGRTLFSAVIKDRFRTPTMNLDSYPDKDPPLYDFVSHRFGQDVAEYLLVPLMRGITAGDAKKLSTRSIVGELLEKEQMYGSVIAGFGKPPITKIAHDELYPQELMDSELSKRLQRERAVMYGLSGGLQTIPERLANSLLNTNNDGKVSIYNQTKVVSMKFNFDNDEDTAPCSVIVETIDGHHIKIDGDHIIAALPSKDLAEILVDSMPQEKLTAFDQIKNIVHHPVGTVSVEYRGNRKELNLASKSGGYLSHPSSDSKALGTFFDSSYFPEKDPNIFRMTCMIGGAWSESMFGTSDLGKVSKAFLEEIALEEIRKVLDIKRDPYRMTTVLWKTGIAQYAPGHKAMLKESRQKIDEFSIPISLVGQSYDGFSFGDVTFGARRAAYDFIKKL